MTTSTWAMAGQEAGNTWVRCDDCVGSTTGPAQIVRFWMPLGLGLNLVTNRVGVYLALMDDRYPSTDDHQSSILTTSIPMPNVISTGGCRW